MSLEGLCEYYADKLLIEGLDYLKVIEEELSINLPYWFKNELIRTSRLIEEHYPTIIEQKNNLRNSINNGLRCIIKDNI